MKNNNISLTWVWILPLGAGGEQLGGLAHAGFTLPFLFAERVPLSGLAGRRRRWGRAGAGTGILIRHTALDLDKSRDLRRKSTQHIIATLRGTGPVWEWCQTVRKVPSKGPLWLMWWSNSLRFAAYRRQIGIDISFVDCYWHQWPKKQETRFFDSLHIYSWPNNTLLSN